jgi:hypothetical protein
MTHLSVCRNGKDLQSRESPPYYRLILYFLELELSLFILGVLNRCYPRSRQSINYIGIK